MCIVMGADTATIPSLRQAPDVGRNIMTAIKKQIIFLLITLNTIFFSFCTNNSNERKNVFGKVSRTPTNEIPVTSDLWWSVHQDSLQIDSFIVKIIESNLNLFNDTSLISYTVYGHVNTLKNSKAEIKQVHISERVNNDPSISFDGLIEITPIVSFSVSENTKSSVHHFHFTNEILLSSIHWGENTIKFTCLNKIQTIQLNQNK